MNINIKIDPAFNARREKLGKKWREVIYTGLDALEKTSTDKPDEVLPPPIPPEEEYKNLLKRLYELWKEKPLLYSKKL